MLAGLAVSPLPKRTRSDRSTAMRAGQAEIDAVFKQLDNDGSGSIEYKELNKKIRAGAGSALDPSLQAGAAGKIETRADLLAKGKQKRALLRTGRKGAALGASVKIEPVEGKSVVEQLREILSKESVRVIDLFRDWDDDGDGMVDKKEFRMAISGLGYTAPRADIDAVFDELDKDKGGSIDYNELNKALRCAGEMGLDPKLMPGGSGVKIETREELIKKAKNKHKSTGSKKGGLMAAMASNMPENQRGDYVAGSS